MMHRQKNIKYNLDRNHSSKESKNFTRSYIITERNFLYIYPWRSHEPCVQKRNVPFKVRLTLTQLCFCLDHLFLTLSKTQDTCFCLPIRLQRAAQRSGNTRSHSVCPWNTGSVTAQPRKKSRSAMKHVVCAKAKRDCEHSVTMPRLVLLRQQKSLHHSLSFLDLHENCNRFTEKTLKRFYYSVRRSESCNS